MVKLSRTAQFRDAANRQAREFAVAMAQRPPPRKEAVLRQLNHFYLTARAIFRGIERLRTFLLESRRDYLNTAKYIYSKASSMTDEERDAIDRESKSYIKDCEGKIGALRGKIAGMKDLINPNERLYLDGITLVLLKRLEHSYPSSNAAIPAESAASEKVQGREGKMDHSQLSLSFTSFAKPASLKKSRPQNPQQAYAKLDEKRKAAEQIERMNLPEEQRQMFEMEVKVIRKQLEEQVDKAKEVEAQMMEIAQLQDLMTNKLMDQGETIQNIQRRTLLMGTQESVFEAVAHVDQGNKHLRDANSASDFRLFIVVFFFTAALALLFMHWYE